MGWGKIMPFTRYSERWRKSRRLANQGFSKRASERYQAGQAKDVHLFLQRTLTEPETVLGELKRCGLFTFVLQCTIFTPQVMNRLTGAIIMRVVYGYPIQGLSDPYTTLSDNALKSLHFTSGLAATHPVDRFPLLSLLPGWLPGMGRKQWALGQRYLTQGMSERPWTWTKNELVSCISQPYLLYFNFRGRLSFGRLTEQRILR